MTHQQAAAEQAEAYCQQHGLGVYMQDAAQLFAALPAPPPDASLFLTTYLASCVCGTNVLWRHYALISGTSFNRQCFLLAVQRCLSGFKGRLSFGDMHSLLQLLCPDFPLSAVKNAWSSALAIQEWLDSQAHTQQECEQPGVSPDPSGLVQVAVFRQCLEVTFTFEQCLLFIRKEAFDENKKCLSMQHLDAAMQRATSTLPQRDLPVPPSRCWRLAVGQASRAGTCPDFAFRDLVRALCCCQELVSFVRRDLQEVAASAASAQAALSSPPDSRNISSDGV